MIRIGILLCSCLLLPAARLPQQAAQHHGEHLGKVQFASSCTPAAQKQLDRAVALLHSFEFGAAISGFRAAAQEDAGCGIAYWGIALSLWGNPFSAGQKNSVQLQKGRDASRLAERTGAKTPRERDYIAAVEVLYSDFEHTPQRARLLAYRDRMQTLAARCPSDPEAQIFYALAMAAAEDPADKTYTARLKAGSLLEKLFELEPDHPGLAHYIIHTYDVPPLADQALSAARRYAEIAPDAPHALHMPSHTFTRLGLWQDSIRSNLQAAASARRAGEVGEELHASDYEVYAYLQTGQDEKARRVLLSLPEIASRFDPEKVVGGAGGPAAGYFALAAIPARFALERGAWSEAAELLVRKTPFPYTDAMTVFARGLGSARMQRAQPAYQAAEQLREIREVLSKAGENYWALQVQIEEAEVRAWALLAESRPDQALQGMQSAAALEDGTEKNAITPGPLAPARELYGEMLAEQQQPARALEQFQATLVKEPGRLRSLYGAARAAELAGRKDLGETYFRELLRTCALADQPPRKELREAAMALKSQSAP